jgi:hypothetical protein
MPSFCRGQSSEIVNLFYCLYELAYESINAASGFEHSIKKKYFGKIIFIRINFIYKLLASFRF